MNVFYNFKDHKAIYQWAFSNLEYTDIVTGTEERAEVKVEYGDGRDFVIVKPAQTYSRIWDRTIPLGSIHEVINLDKNVVAPVKTGDKLGTLELQYAGESLVTIDLVATSDLARSSRAETLTVAKSFIGSEGVLRRGKMVNRFFPDIYRFNHYS